MERKIKSIYEWFCDYSEDEINAMISNLTLEQQELIKDRYGENLYNPVTSNNFTKDKSVRFYSYLIPKMRRLLAERKIGELKASVEKETDLKAKVLELIDSKKNSVEICEILNITSKQLYNLLLELRNTGKMISRKYYSNGSIQYRPIKKMQTPEDLKIYNPDKTIITEPSENNIKTLVISDLHFGNKSARLDLVRRAYNYCIKNGIHIILLGGDLIDGTFTLEEQIISDVYKQIEYFINNYPYDKSVLNFGVAGDHDLSALTSNGFNIIEALNNYRHDVVIGDFNNTIINIKNDQIMLFHSIKNGGIKSNKAPILLHGHSHNYKTYFEGGKLQVRISSLSDIITFVPTALELDLNFDKGYITNANIKQIYFASKDIVLSEAEYHFLTNRNINDEPVRNIEKYKNNSDDQVASEEKNTIRVLQPQPSQIEKFNKRYNK